MVHEGCARNSRTSSLAFADSSLFAPFCCRSCAIPPGSSLLLAVAVIAALTALLESSPRIASHRIGLSPSLSVAERRRLLVRSTQLRWLTASPPPPP